ncbi:MAG: BsuBI/PstI family type II restriction endonuclease [Lachnospiraceae bacterium]
MTAETLEMLHSIGGHKADSFIKRFITYHEKLIEIYASKKELTKMPVKINNREFTFSAGKHNELLKAIAEEFAPRFAPNSECLYVSDTIWSASQMYG